MREVQKRQLQTGPQGGTTCLKGLQIYKEKQEELFMMEKHILPGTHPVGEVLGVLKRGWVAISTACTISRTITDGAGDTGPQRRQDATSLTRQRVVDEAGTLRRWGAGGATGREKSLGCAGGVTRSWWRPTCIIPPIWVYCGMGCGADPGDGASGGGTGGRLAATPASGQAGEGGVQSCARHGEASRRLVCACRTVRRKRALREGLGMSRSPSSSRNAL